MVVRCGWFGCGRCNGVYIGVGVCVDGVGVAVIWGFNLMTSTIFDFNLL